MGGNLVNLVAFTICSSTGIPTSSPPSPGWSRKRQNSWVEALLVSVGRGIRGQYELTELSLCLSTVSKQTTSGELFFLFFRPWCWRSGQLLDVRTMLVEAPKGWWPLRNVPDRNKLSSIWQKVFQFQVKTARFHLSGWFPLHHLPLTVPRFPHLFFNSLMLLYSKCQSGGVWKVSALRCSEEDASTHFFLFGVGDGKEKRCAHPISPNQIRRRTSHGA